VSQPPTGTPKRNRLKSALRIVLGLALVVAGFNHFRAPDFYLRMIPPVLPAPLAIVYISGIAEIVLGALLCLQRTATIATWGTIALLVAVFPANLYMALNPGEFPEFSATALWVRLPFQAVLIALVYWCGAPLDRNPAKAPYNR